GLTVRRALPAPRRLAARAWTPEEAAVELVRGRLQALGPVTPAELAASLGLPVAKIDAALAALETEGFALRGRFTRETPETAGIEWCERRLLARIHRFTPDRLRRCAGSRAAAPSPPPTCPPLAASAA